MEAYEILSILEGILFLSGDPVEVRDLASVFDMTVEETQCHLQQLAQDYNVLSRGLQISMVGNSVRLTTKAEIFPHIEKMFKPIVKSQISKAALETLSIIMFKQPITRAEVEFVRGVNSERALNGLLEKGLILEAGRLETTGRPILYETTQLCMEHFGLRSFEDIPGEIKEV